VVKSANWKTAEIDRPIEQKKLAQRTPVPGSRRAAIIVAEQAVAAYAEEAAMTDVQGDDILPVLSCPKDSKESNRNKEQLAETVATKTNHKSVTEPSNPLHVKSGGDEEAALQRPELEVSSDSSSLPPSSLSYAAGAGAAIQEPGTDQEIEVVPVQKVTSVQRTSPNSMIRAKAGHYMSRSPLVATDTEDMERHAKAMTNGKGDWQNRATQMLKALTAPSKNRALTEGSPSSTATEVRTAQDLAAASMPDSISDTPMKRKFGELTNLNGLGMSPKVRREELARKKRVKQETLEKAKAEADALRRQVEEFEAGQAEAIAQEEAEVSQEGCYK
jgi:hypothetical protein